MAQKSMLMGSMPIVGTSTSSSSLKAASAYFKKFKISDIVTIGSGGKPSAAGASKAAQLKNSTAM